MKDHFGLEVHLRKWKLYLIQDRHGYGFFLKSAKLLTVLFITKSSTIKVLKNSNKILKVANFSCMEKEPFLVILHKTKFASQIKINTVFMTLLS